MTGTRIVAGGVLAAALVGGLALYGSGSNLSNLVATRPCAEADATVARVGPQARGQVAAFDVAQAPRVAPDFRFKTPDGSETHLGAMRGKALLVNLWATWCAPCKAEMPALDRLQNELGGERFEVIALNVDTRNVDKVPAWLADNRIDHLAAHTDPSGRALPAIQQHTGTAGLPTTLLIDAKGCELGVIKGPADWASEDGKRLIRAALGS